MPEIKTTTTRTEETVVEEKPIIETTVAVEEAAPVESPTMTEKVEEHKLTITDVTDETITEEITRTETIEEQVCVSKGDNSNITKYLSIFLLAN